MIMIQETLAKSCGSRSSGNLEQRSYSSLSRSQQRTLGGGNFGSRTTAGTGIGTGAGQDSSEGSGNSIRDENNLRMQTIITPVDNKPSDIMPVNLPSQRHSDDNYLIFNKKISKKYSTESGNTELTTIESKNNCNDDDFDSEINDKNEKNTNRVINGDMCHQRRLADSNDDYDVSKRQGRGNNKSKYFGLRINNDKKWWRFFKWLPAGGVFKFTKNSRQNPGESAVSDIESNREEYSMTTCYIAGEHRLV